MATLLKSPNVTSIQHEDDEINTSLEHLEDEMIIKMISFLSPWEVMALEATNKRMQGLVRAEQTVQLFLDITYPSSGWEDSRKSRLSKSIEKMILSRFGPKLLKISQDTKHAHYESLFRSATFMAQLAIKCPNLIELPTSNFVRLHAYARGRTSGIRKMTIIVCDFDEEFKINVKDLFRGTPLLVDFTLIINKDHDQLEDTRIAINEIGQALLLTNCVRRFIIYFKKSVGIGAYPAVLQLVRKLPMLKQFTLLDTLNKEEYYEPVLKLFQGIECSKTLITDDQSTVNKSALREHVHIYVSPVLREYTNLRDEHVLAIANLDNVGKLSFTAPNKFKKLPPLVIPLSVQELTMTLNESHYDYIASCMRAHGRKLLELKIDCDDMSAESINQLLISIAEGCAKLKSLELVTRRNVLREENLRIFLTISGKTLEKLTLGPTNVSIGLLELISQKCTSLKQLNCNVFLHDGLLTRMKELIFKMVNLREAEIRLLKRKKREFYASGHYMNRKLVFMGVEKK